VVFVCGVLAPSTGRRFLTLKAETMKRIAVKLLKDWNQRKAGEILPLVEVCRADVLIRKGFAEAATTAEAKAAIDLLNGVPAAKPKAKPKTKAKK